jgi:predicted transcriptional regulator
MVKQRSVYIDDELWRRVKIEAASRDKTSSQVVAAALERYFAARAQTQKEQTGG